MVAAPYTVSNSYKGYANAPLHLRPIFTLTLLIRGLFMKTYARNVRRAWDGEEYRAPKRFRLDTNTNVTEDTENEDRLDRVIRESSVTVTISSSPSRKNSTIFSGESQEDEDAATTPPSSPPPQISPIKEKTRKPTFSTLKRKRDNTRDASEPLSEVFNSSSRASLPPKKPPPQPQNLVQMRLDLGQSDTRKSCTDCGMEYVPSNEEDASLHKMYHNMNSDGVELGKAFMKSAMKWVYEVPHIEGSVVVVDRKISPPARKEVQKVLEVVNKELSATSIEAEMLWSQKSLSDETDKPVEKLKQSESEKRNDHKSDRYKMFLHVKNGKCIAACLAERIIKAQQVKKAKVPQVESVHKSSSIEVEDETVPAIVGVSRIWTSKAHRRKGIAINLLDCVLNQFIYGMEIDKDELAFSQPTESGGELARSWYGEESGWLVYNEA
jgi:N-acetyltransferase